MKTLEILMVEDNPGDVVLLKEAMQRVGLTHRVRIVRDGVEAIEYLRRQGLDATTPCPDLIILDLKLPRKSGREVLDEIQPNPFLQKIPFIVFSSSQSELESARSCKLQARAYLVKPSTFEGYVEFVRQIAKYEQGSLT